MRMSRRHFLKSTGSMISSAGLLSIFSSCPSTTYAAQKSPNVILIMTDDQGYPDLGCHGNPYIQTPNLDRFYKQSVRLTDFHVDPLCTPTRAALLTGRYSIRTGAWRAGAGRSLLRRDEVTLANLFSASGYRTAMFSKWHLGDNYPYRPHDRGFHETVWHQHGAIGMAADSWGNDYFDDVYKRNDKSEKFSGYCTDVFFDEAIKFVDANKANPFYVPQEYSKPYLDKGLSKKLANYMGMVTNIDENFGRLIQKLKEWNLERNTIVIFMTDNGSLGGVMARKRGGRDGFLYDKLESLPGFLGNMRGRKGSPYEGGHRVPCFIRWPKGGLTSGKDIKSLTAHIDLMPTLIELCGLKKPASVKFDGVSIVPLLKGQKPVEDRTLFVEHTGGDIVHPSFELQPYGYSAVLTPRWRLVYGEELYDIIKDPLQKTDVAQQYPQVVKQLRKAHERWFADVTEKASEPCRIIIGSKEENPIRLNLQDWYMPKDNPPWYQRPFHKYPCVSSSPAPYVNGPWMVEVAHSGRYEITLRQLPIEANYPIQATEARIKIGKVDETKKIPDGATAVTFTVQLDSGDQSLQTWFTENNGKSRGAFYVYIRRL
ncbi:MAG: arylsulfatase [Planctomycetota bacterium]